MNKSANLISNRASVAAAGLLLAVIIWGVSFVVVKEAISVWPVFPFLAIRFWIAAIAFLPLIWKERQNVPQNDRNKDQSIVWLGIAAGTSLFLAYAFQTYGLVVSRVATAAFLTSLYLVFVPLFLLLKSSGRASRIEWIAVLLALGGIYSFAEGADSGSRLGTSLFVACAACFAIQVIVVGVKIHRSRPILFTAVQVLVVAIASTIAAVPWLANNGYPVPSVGVLASAIFLGVFATTFAFLLQTWSQHHLSATQAVLILAMEPVFAVIAGSIVLSEVLIPATILGGVFILSATLLSQLVRSTE